MANILDFGGVRALTSNAQPGAGYVAEFYVSGTTTPVIVYTDSTLGTAHGTSVTADAAGRFPAVWSSGGAVKCVIKDADGAAVQTIDPVFSVSGAGSDAEDVTFTPTVELPFTNVQDAIVGAAASAASGYAAFGIGITGNAVLLANIDATNIGAGVYRFDGTTTGTYPTGVAAADLGLVEMWRQAAAVGIMELFHATTNRRFRRRLTAGTWAVWREVLEVKNIAGGSGSVEWQLDKSASGQTSRLWGATNDLGRWAVDLGNNVAESGSNVGSDFVIKRYDDAGAFLADAFSLRRSNGQCLIYGEIAMVNNSKIAWNNNISINVGTGSPEGVVTAPIGSLYLRTDGGAGTSLYVKQTGTGNTGWVGK
jgi:hypothetical protein